MDLKEFFKGTLHRMHELMGVDKLHSQINIEKSDYSQDIKKIEKNINDSKIINDNIKNYQEVLPEGFEGVHQTLPVLLQKKEKLEEEYKILMTNLTVKIHDIYYENFKNNVDKLEFFNQHYDYFFYCKNDIILNILLEGGASFASYRYNSTIEYNIDDYKKIKNELTLTVMRINAYLDAYDSPIRTKNPITNVYTYDLYEKCAKYYCAKYHEYHKTAEKDDYYYELEKSFLRDKKKFFER